MVFYDKREVLWGCVRFGGMCPEICLPVCGS